MEDKVVSAVKDFASSINSGGKIVADMSSLVDATSQLPLANFDYWERLIRHEFSNALEVTTSAKWKVWYKPSQQLTWLDLISWDGYKREKTLRTISGSAPNAFFFSLSVRRLNDWVPAVREAAREKLPLIAKETEPNHVVDALCIAISNWNSWGRIEEVDRQVLLQIVSRKEIAESLKSKVISSASGPMPSLFSQLGRTSILDGYLDEIAENAIQPSVRARAYRCQFEGRMVWIEGREWEWTDIRYCKGRLKAVISERKMEKSASFINLLTKSAADRSSIVRRVSAEFLIRELEKLGDESIPFAEQFASDKSAPVSERGRFALKRLKELSSGNASCVIKEYGNLAGKFPFPVYSYELDGWDDLNKFSVKTDNFVMLLLADYSKKPMEEIAEVARQLIDKGLKYICCWGPESTVGHHGFDRGNIEWEEENKTELHVMSTSHEEPLADAVWFCLYCATPDDESWENCSTVIVNVDSAASSGELDKLLSEVDYLNRETIDT